MRFSVFENLGLDFAGRGISEWRRLQWWRREEIEVKREKEASIEKQETKREYLSLEELLLASPGPSSEQGFGNGGKFNVSRHGGFKRKVHPTRICNSSSICERSGGAVGESVADQDEFSGGSFSICRSESGKLKKKVSFRLPEVSEVIVIYSPEEGASADDANVAS